MLVPCCHTTYWRAGRAYTAQAPGQGRHDALGDSGCQRCNLGPPPGPRRGGASVWRMLCCVCPIACEQAPWLGSPGPSPARSQGRSSHPWNWDAEDLPMRPRHGYAYAPSSLTPSQCPGTHPPPARWPPRQPCRLRGRRRVRTGCAPPAAPQCPDHTHVQMSQRRRSHPRKTSGPVRWPLLPLAGWFSVTPGLCPSPPHPQKPAGRPPPFGAILTLFGAPAGRSVFSLPAGPDANVEKDGSSASLTAMSDSPGGCLRAGRGTSRSQGATLDCRSAASHRPPAFTPSPRPALHLPH